MTFPKRATPNSTGFTLIEVILALAILAGSVATLGEVMRIASRHATESAAESRAQLLACSVLDEIACGYRDLANVSRQPLEADDSNPWVVTVTLGTTRFANLSSIEVVVEQDLEPQYNPVRYSVVRWFSTLNQTSTTGANQNSSQTTNRGGGGRG